MSGQEEDEYSRVRCDGYWYDVLEREAEVAELLDHGSGDWVELSEVPNGRPIWLRASRVDYVQGGLRAEYVEFDELVAGLMLASRGPCTIGRTRHAGSLPARRSRLRARCAESWRVWGDVD